MAIRKWHQWLLKAGEEHNMPQGKGTEKEEKKIKEFNRKMVINIRR